MHPKEVNPSRLAISLQQRDGNDLRSKNGPDLSIHTGSILFASCHGGPVQLNLLTIQVTPIQRVEGHLSGIKIAVVNEPIALTLACLPIHQLRELQSHINQEKKPVQWTTMAYPRKENSERQEEELQANQSEYIEMKRNHDPQVSQLAIRETLRATSLYSGEVLQKTTEKMTQ